MDSRKPGDMIREPVVSEDEGTTGSSDKNDMGTNVNLEEDGAMLDHGTRLTDQIATNDEMEELDMTQNSAIKIEQCEPSETPERGRGHARKPIF